MRAKKVSDTIFKLSVVKPISKDNPYNVIQRSSAVNNKCREEFEEIKNVENKNKNDKINRLESPKNIIL